MNHGPWRGFNAVDETQDPDYYIRYLDELRHLGDTAQYKARSFDLLELQPGARVLDVGCGTGPDAFELARRVGAGGCVQGVDPSEQLIAEARRRAAGRGLPVQFQVGDIYRLPFADESFDACRADRVFLYLDRPAAGLAEMARVLRPGGTLYARDPDMQTFLVDAPDRKTTRAVADFFSDSFASGWIGRQFPRLFRETGVADFQYCPRTLVLRTLAEADTMFALRRTLAGAVNAGVLPSADGDAWLASLEEADRLGRFVFSLTFFETYGRKGDRRSGRGDETGAVA
jgi:ubiquinone/menaquinone biosynthesis C-methylase UbiE